MSVKCPRCHGLLAVDYMNDILTDGIWREQSKCLNCGSVTDAVIEANRLTPPVLTRGETPGRRGYKDRPPLTVKGVSWTRK